MVDESSQTGALLARAAAGDKPCWHQLLLQHEKRLRRLVDVRLDLRLRKRIDPEDVLQEVYLEAFVNLPLYVQQAPMPFYLWLRGITINCLLMVHRHHLDAEMRAIDREVPLGYQGLGVDSSVDGADQDRRPDTQPSAASMQDEMRNGLREALSRLRPADCEVLTLRHFEQLTTVEIAQVLRIPEGAARQRYVRALKRLKGILGEMPASLWEIDS